MNSDPNLKLRVNANVNVNAHVSVKRSRRCFHSSNERAGDKDNIGPACANGTRMRQPLLLLLSDKRAFV